MLCNANSPTLYLLSYNTVVVGCPLDGKLSTSEYPSTRGPALPQCGSHTVVAFLYTTVLWKNP